MDGGGGSAYLASAGLKTRSATERASYNTKVYSDARCTKRSEPLETAETIAVIRKFIRKKIHLGLNWIEIAEIPLSCSSSETRDVFLLPKPDRQPSAATRFHYARLFTPVRLVVRFMQKAVASRHRRQPIYSEPTYTPTQRLKRKIRGGRTVWAPVCGRGSRCCTCSYGPQWPIILVMYGSNIILSRLDLALAFWNANICFQMAM